MKNNILDPQLMLGMIFQTIDEDFWFQLANAHVMNGCE